MVDKLTHCSRWFAAGLLSICACGGSDDPSLDDGGTPTVDGSTSMEDGSMPMGDGSTALDGGDRDGGPPAGAWHVVTGAAEDGRITGIHCPSASGCVVAADEHLYAIDSTSVSSTLMTSDNALGEAVGILGQPVFFGFSLVGDTLVARLDAAGHGFISATGDFLAPASWTVGTLGTTPRGFALNPQYGLGSDSAGWLLFNNGRTFRAPSPAAAETVWMQVWSPRAGVPSDFAERRAADPTLCTSDPGYSDSPRPTQAAYVAGDLAIVLSPAGALNQATDDVTGVCISTNGGLDYHLAPLMGAESLDGPSALHCVSADHCVVGGGSAFVNDSVYIYASRDASGGATSTWVPSTIPAHTSGMTFLRHFFFAPGGIQGWVVGSNANAPLLWTTTDGGTTWTDASGSVAALTSERLWAGFALDATHLVVGGEHGALLSTF